MGYGYGDPWHTVQLIFRFGSCNSSKTVEYAYHGFFPTFPTCCSNIGWIWKGGEKTSY